LFRERPEIGTKRVCLNCGTRFYDLRRVPPTCPKCGTEFIVVARPLPKPTQSKKKAYFKKTGPEQPIEPEEPKDSEEEDASSDEEERSQDTDDDV